VTIEFAHGESLMGTDLSDLVSLAEVFAEEVEEDAGREYHAEDKEEHLTEDAARFLVARSGADGKVVGFAHFRFTMHGELADVMEGEPCLFVYDVHVAEGAQRKGLAKHLVRGHRTLKRAGAGVVNSRPHFASNCQSVAYHRPVFCLFVRPTSR